MAEPQNTKTVASGALFENKSNSMNPSSRTVRVFLSSTFRDFAEERDLLVRQIFPELRRKCRERQVELIDVDLRWGITEKEAQQGKVLPICLAEIDRARPYFMGFIGERYGWIPASDQYDPSILQEQPWLVEHRGGKSVTELEILHGVLNDPAMAGRAFFYFRDPKYSHTKGGVYIGESSEEERQLNELKDRIRKSGFPVVEKYQNPPALAERVRADLWKLIDEAFPLEEVPDALAMERRRHDAYGASRLGMYLGGEPYFAILDEAMEQPENSFQPLLVTGDSGVGKTALLANWLQGYRKASSNCHIIVHHLSSSSDAADPVRMAHRLIREVLAVTGDKINPKSEPDEILAQLSDVLILAADYAAREGTKWLIILDGLDKISSHRNLDWFPWHLPGPVKLVVSCLEDGIKHTLLCSPKADSLDDLMRISDLSSDELETQGIIRNWTLLNIQPLTKAQRRDFIVSFLGRFRKSLGESLIVQIVAFPLSSNPFFLLTLLEELRLFGRHQEVADRLDKLLNKPSRMGVDENYTVDSLFEHVLSRLEEDIGINCVVAALKALWASRNGLNRDELLAITGMPPAKWAEIQNALDENLIEIGGLITFGSDFLRKAVQDMYLPDHDDQRTAHQQLAEWFGEQELTKRAFLEVVWQWQESGMWDKLVRSPDVRATLSPRECEVLELRFGNNDGQGNTIDEVSLQLKTTPDRVRQIEGKALRKIRHPDRLRKLDGFITLPE
jgi:nephrocystin-3